MHTPIYNFLKKYQANNIERLHMPGHKGDSHYLEKNLEWGFDITEISGADSLFEATGIIAESEQIASGIFGTKHTVYSTSGSSLSIQAMLTMVKWNRSGKVLALRNVHKSFVNAVALLGVEVEWVYSDDAGFISCKISHEIIERKLANSGRISCIYLTSPDYYGRVQDIEQIAIIAHKYGVPLIVDNAHGAHLAFLNPNTHPIMLGADICCDSAHKTLPVLTGGGYLHVSNSSDKFFKKYPLNPSSIKQAMGIFGSTSPSYLVLCSLDLCNKFLSESGKACGKEITNAHLALKNRLSSKWNVLDTEPSKISINTLSRGISGNLVAEYLRVQGIECEYADSDSIVLLFSLSTKPECYDRVGELLTNEKLLHISSESSLNLGCGITPIFKPIAAVSIREATLSPQEILPIEDSEGRICGVTRINCPPGVPIVCAGEIVTSEVIKILKKYSILHINVLK